LSFTKSAIEAKIESLDFARPSGLKREGRLIKGKARTLGVVAVKTKWSVTRERFKKPN
jgi:hypothetical protein